MVHVATFSTALVFSLVLCSAWPRAATALTSGTAAPGISGENWINSKPLTIASLRGRVILIEFWTYG